MVGERAKGERRAATGDSRRPRLGSLEQNQHGQIAAQHLLWLPHGNRTRLFI